MYDITGKEIGQVNLNSSLFGAKIDHNLLHEVVIAYLARRRSGTASSKRRAEVRGGGRKPWRQKHTGRARAGSIRSPIWVGGGTVFGPHPRDYGYSIPKKVKRQALLAAFSSKAKDKDIVVLDELKLKEAKTRLMVDILNNLRVGLKPLIVIADHNEEIIRASRNLPGVGISLVQNLNVYTLLNHNKLVITQGALSKLAETFKDV
jgi:large subunit ribosomal protein L4